MPNGRCRLHGGKSLGGIASPRFKHGRYSKHVMFQPPSPSMAWLTHASQDTSDVGLRRELAYLTVWCEELYRELFRARAQPDLPLRAEFAISREARRVALVK